MIRAVPVLVVFAGWLWGYLALLRRIGGRSRDTTGVEIEITEVQE